MKIDLNQEELDKLIKAVKTDKNFCERTLKQKGILPNYVEYLKECILQDDNLLNKLS